MVGNSAVPSPNGLTGKARLRATSARRSSRQRSRTQQTTRGRHVSARVGTQECVRWIGQGLLLASADVHHDQIDSDFVVEESFDIACNVTVPRNVTLPEDAGGCTKGLEPGEDHDLGRRACIVSMYPPLPTL